ncbi:hypothetical protein BDA99DRAFT_517156 [Phascolomyces articulosus]|uniref:Uncharacterized protein n=1 Tax=Phascolomyces articulosus TaxID=60185 RepID=A0AAD5JV52_9FUNG|nr:hypothetical protein BDA99DRAFT_517156 [Phascolomyces articulosus]
MVKEANSNAHPKAVNIIRPTHSLSVKRSTQQTHLPSTTASTTIPNNKPRVTNSAKINVEESNYSTRKPQLNIYHPPPKRSQSQRPIAASNAHRQQSVRKVRPTVTTGTTATPRSKPSFEVYKPPIKQPFSRSRTTPVISTTSSTPISISNHFHRQQSSYQQIQRRSVSQAVSTLTNSPSSSPLARSITHNSFATSTSPSSLYINHDSGSNDSSNSISSNNISSEDDTYECPEMQFSKRESHSSSDADILVTNTALESKKEKSMSSHEDDEGGEDEEEDSIINEARVNRKIADLEISNRSLLAVNEMLEMTVRRQASQVAHLKQQIAQDGITVIKSLVPSIEDNESPSDEEWEKDPMFHRIHQMTENMIKSGEASLQYECKRLGGRVLTNFQQPEENILTEEHEIGKEEMKEDLMDGNGVEDVQNDEQDVEREKENGLSAESNGPPQHDA